MKPSVTVRYMGLEGTSMKTATVELALEWWVDVSFWSGNMCVSRGRFSLRDGWGLGHMSMWRLTRKDFDRLRQAALDAGHKGLGSNRWKSKSRAPWQETKTVKKAKPKPEPKKQLKLFE